MKSVFQDKQTDLKIVTEEHGTQEASKRFHAKLMQR